MEELYNCPSSAIRALNDTLNVLNGKWKLPIIGALLSNKKRFNELERFIPKITPRMLSKELRDLEANGMITRTVLHSTSLTVFYELTDAGRSLSRVLKVMIEWGIEHRKNVIGR